MASLLALNDPKLDSLVTAYCQQFGIGSRVASFLVLENETDYKRLNLEEERGKTVPAATWASSSTRPGQSLGKVGLRRARRSSASSTQVDAARQAARRRRTATTSRSCWPC